MSFSVRAEEAKQLVVPYAPGGVVDSFGRIVQKYMIEDLGIDTVLLNNPGADARRGVKSVASKPADGNTWIVESTGPFLFNKVIYKDPGYHHENFDLVLPMAVSPSVIVVSNQSGINTLPEFIRYAKTKPMNCGVSNSGAIFLTTYLVSALNLSNIEIINYKGASEVSTALISGTIECSIDTLQSQMPYHKNNSLKIIAISSQHKHSNLPDAVLFSTVIPKFVFNSWYGVGVLKSTPVRAKARILQAMRTINQNANYQNAIRTIGLDTSDPALDVNEFISTEYNRFNAIRQAAGIAKLN